MLALAGIAAYPSGVVATRLADHDGRISYGGVRYSVDPEILGTRRGEPVEARQGTDGRLRIYNRDRLVGEHLFGADYGAWHRLAMANHHLAEIVAADRREGYLPIALLANCSSLLGMVAGLQHSGPGRAPLKVGMVFIDAHGDFNTPETTLSGMLGGMPVAVASGACLTNLRHESGLDPALPTRHVVLGAVRDTDPLEEERLDRSEIVRLTVADLRQRSLALHREMERLSSLTDVIYVHVDMDVLDPREVPGHPLAVPDGPTSEELAAALGDLFAYPKAAAFGVASTPTGDRDPDGLSRQAAYRLIRGVVEGLQRR